MVTLELAEDWFMKRAKGQMAEETWERGNQFDSANSIKQIHKSYSECHV